MPESSRPHIILIMTDQQRYDSIRSSGSPWMQTPNLDRLADEGIRFDQCYCTAPSCVPSRASFFTCRYPHEIDVFRNGDRWTPTWVQSLRDAGYHTANIGKMHTVPISQPGGFDQRYIVENKDRPHDFTRPHGVFLDEWDRFLNNSHLKKPGRLSYRDEHPLYETALGAYDWELPEEYHSDAFVATMAEWFLDQRRAETPLFLQVGFPGPHPPFDPPPRSAELYSDVSIPVPELTEEAYHLQPPAQHRYREEMIRGNHDAVRWHERPTPQQLLRLRRYYAGCVTFIDEQIGRLLSALERNGYLDNSLIVFTSDHGECLGDHGHIQKWTMYDEVTRVPAIVWGPGIVGSRAPVDGFVQHLDFVPMMFQLAGVPMEDPGSSVSAMSVLDGGAGRDAVFAEHGRCNMLPDIERLSMVRNREWKLVSYGTESDGELYDLVNDPRELVNRWNDTGLAGIRSEMLSLLDGFDPVE